MPSENQSHQGISLHIGVNRVDPTHYSGWSGDLASPENDADTMQAIASARGFTASQLKTEQATRENVIQAIQDVAAQLTPVDMFLLTYAGHGGQMKDLDGDEADRKDDTWILFDGQLLDDEMNVMFAKFKPGCRVLMISDSCHSGTMLKGGAKVEDTVERVQDDFDESRLMPRQASIETAKMQREFYAQLQRNLPRPHPPINASVRLISGCQEHERSWGNKETGRFTAALKQVFAGGAFDGGYEEFHRQIVKALETAKNPQTPGYQAVGAPDEDFDRQVPFQI